MTTRTTTPSARIALSLSVGLLMLMIYGGGGRPAEAAAKRLGVVTFRGPGEGATRNAVTKAAKQAKYEVVGGQQISKAASRLKVSLENNDGFEAVAKELGISAFVTGEVSKKKATLTVRNGADGSVSAEASWTGPNPRKLSQAVNKTFWRRLGSAIDRTKAPSGAKQAVVAEEAAAPESGADDGGDDDKDKDKGSAAVAASDDDAGDDSKKSSRREKREKKDNKKKSDDDSSSETVVSEKAEPPEEADDGGERPVALILSAGPRVTTRSLNYTQDIFRGNSKYSLGAAPEVGLNFDLYPAAFSMSGLAANIGLTGDLSYMLPVVTSPAPMGTGSYTTYALNWSVGLKVRLPMGIYGTAAYGDQRFQLVKPSSGSGIDVPAVDYRYAKIGAGARIKATNELSVMGNAAYLQCLSLGTIASQNYFPKAKCKALEIGLGVGYRISKMFEIQAGAELRRYGLAFNVLPADAAAGHRVAGGAIDQYLMFYGAIAVILGGSESGGGGHHAAAEEEAESSKSAKADEEESDKEKADSESSSKTEKRSKKKSKKSADEEDL